jgi:multimeric flavodoxin WrbA
MKLAIINGNERHGSTWHSMDAVRQALGRYGEVEATEFFLPKDMPHFCHGCFSCFYNGEHTCPHASSVQPIVSAMMEADVIVLTSPVYGFDVSGQIKALLDHLCYMWMSHRPNPKMFGKIGLTVSTTAGAGVGHAAKTLRHSLKYWGALRVLSFRIPVSAMKWKDVSDKRKARIEKDAARIAKRIAGYVEKADRMQPTLFKRFFFALMKGMMRGNDWNPRDRQHWADNGWIPQATVQSEQKA